MPDNPFRVSANSISLHIREPVKNQDGTVKLGSLISKENLDLFLLKAKESPDYAKAKDKFEFRVKQSNGQVFLELKRRSPGFFRKLFAFVGSGRRMAERNDAMFALAKYRNLGLSDVNRLANSRTAYASTTKSDARRFQQEIVESRDQALVNSAANRKIWSTFSQDDKRQLLENAAKRHGMEFFVREIDESTVLQKPMYALDAVEDRRLTNAEARELAENALDRFWARGKQKIDLLKDMGLIGATIEQQFKLEKELLRAGPMDAAYFEGAKNDALMLAKGLRSLASIPAEATEERYNTALSMMTQLKDAAKGRGLNGLQEFGDLAPLVAYIAKADPDSVLQGVENLRETLNYLTQLCTDIQINDDSPNYTEIAIPAAHTAALVACLEELL